MQHDSKWKQRNIIFIQLDEFYYDFNLPLMRLVIYCPNINNKSNGHIFIQKRYIQINDQTDFWFVIN